jgi:glycosyltransferase involved in cell wall biosynthesis
MIKVMQVSTRHNVGGISRLNSVLLSINDTKNVFVTGECEANEKEFSLDFLETTNTTFYRIHSMRRSLNLWRDLISLKQIYRVIKIEKPDIIHTHMSKAGCLARIAAIISKSDTQLIHSYHGLVLDNYFSNFLSKFFLLIERILASQTDAIICDSAIIKKEVSRLQIMPKHTSHVILPGLIKASNSFTQKKEVSSVLKILMVSRLEPIKRLDRAIDALFIAQKIDPNISFEMIVVGDGQMRTSLEQRSKEMSLPVSFVGWQSSLVDFYLESHVLLLSSESEGTPLTVMEAAHFGCPTISTAVGGIPDIVEDGETGILCPPEAGALAHAIVRVFRNREELNKMAFKAHEKAKSDFSVETFLSKHLALYESLAPKIHQ